MLYKIHFSQWPGHESTYAASDHNKIKGKENVGDQMVIELYNYSLVSDSAAR